MPSLVLAGLIARVSPFLFALVAALSVTTAAGTATAATLRGVVVDEADRTVPFAAVQVVGPLGAQRAETDDRGRFEVAGLAPGTYRVLVSAPSLETTASRVTLAADAVADVRVVMTVRALSETVVVSASHVEVPLSSAPGSVSVVGAGELRARQIDSLAGALTSVPGLTISRNGGPGALASLFPRGGESDFTLVLVDGVRLNTFGGTVDLSQVTLGGIDRVEIVRGPQSALYGSDAIGGVVHVVRRESERPALEGVVEGGSRDTTRYTLSGGASHRAWSWTGSAERQASDGDRRLAPATGERVKNDDWRLLTGSMSVGWQPSTVSRVRAVGRVLESERGAPGPYGSNPIGVFEEVDTFARGRNDQAQAGVSAEHAWGGRLASRARQRWTLGWADLDSDFRSQFQDFVFESGLQTRRFNVRSQSDIVLSATSSLSAGLEVQRERARSTFVTGERAQEVPIERHTAGYFGELRQALGARMALTAGLRVEDIRRTSLEGDPFAFSPRPAFADDRRQSVNPRVSWTWAVHEDDRGGQTRVHAGAGTGIRPPDVFEIAFTDNPALKPERSRSMEAGVSHRLSPAGATLQLTAFRNTYDDLIVAVGQALRGSSRYRTDNISNARAHGVELSADWRPMPALQVRAAYTWLDTEILEVDGTAAVPAPFRPGDPLVRRPPHAGSVVLQYVAPRLTAYAEAYARGRTLDIEPNFGASGGLFHNDGFAVVDAGASWRLAPRVEIFGRGMNLLNRRYEETLGYPAAERRGAVGVRIAVGH